MPLETTEVTRWMPSALLSKPLFLMVTANKKQCELRGEDYGKIPGLAPNHVYDAQWRLTILSHVSVVKRKNARIFPAVPNLERSLRSVRTNSLHWNLASVRYPWNLAGYCERACSMNGGVA